MNQATVFAKEQELMLDDQKWIVRLVDNDGVYMKNAESGASREFTHCYLDAALGDNRVAFLNKHKDYKPELLTKTEQEECKVKEAICRKLLTMPSPFGLTGSEIKGEKYNCEIAAREVIAEHRSKMATPSKSELSRLRAHFIDHGDLTHYLIKSRKKRGSKFPIEVELLISQNFEHVLLQKNGPTIAESYRILVQTAPDAIRARLPSESAYRRRVANIDMQTWLLHRYGKAAVNEYRRGGGGNTRVTRLMERVELDAMHITLGVTNKKKEFLGYVVIYFCIDVLSRMPVGYHVEIRRKLRGESASGVAASIKHMIKKKMPIGSNYLYPLGGLAETIVTDHGSAYACKQIRDLCENLNISIQHTGTKKGWGKGVAERFVRTLRDRFFKNIKGYRDHKHLKNYREGRPEHFHSIELNELLNTLEHFMYETYSKTKHKGLKYATPQQKWEKHYRKAAPAEPKRIFHESAFRCDTKLCKVNPTTGVFLDGMYFNSKALKQMFFDNDNVGNQRKSIPMRVYFDLNDAKELTVVDPSTGEAVTAVNIDQDVTKGMSFAEATQEYYNNKAKPSEAEPNASHTARSNRVAKQKKRRSGKTVPQINTANELENVFAAGQPDTAVKSIETEDRDLFECDCVDFGTED